MKKIIALTDYKNKFGSKHFDQPYRSGMDKEKLKSYFRALEYELEFIRLNEINDDFDAYKNQYILYTSSEDIGYHYKSYIEDIIYSLELIGANVIPTYKHLRANNNKVFMELLRKDIDQENNLKALVFGSLNDIITHSKGIKYPCVFKTAEGASGTGVFLANNKDELINIVKKNSSAGTFKENIKDFLRAYRHKGYIREDVFRKKFIIQDLIPSLKNDWKLYIFGEKIYIFKRPIQKGRGIKASGGGYDNYFYGIEANAPNGIFNFAFSFFKKLNIPHVSLDIAFDGLKFYIIEFQAIYFGTAGIPYSKGYFTKKNEEWIFIEKMLEIEDVYAQSIVWFLK